MPEVLASPTNVPTAGEPPKEIAEFAGNASTGDDAFSVARMRVCHLTRAPRRRLISS
jgi:hypothetical protein